MTTINKDQELTVDYVQYKLASFKAETRIKPISKDSIKRLEKALKLAIELHDKGELKTGGSISGMVIKHLNYLFDNVELLLDSTTLDSFYNFKVTQGTRPGTTVMQLGDNQYHCNFTLEG